MRFSWNNSRTENENTENSKFKEKKRFACKKCCIIRISFPDKNSGLQPLRYLMWCVMRKHTLSRLQTTRETAANMFHGCLLCCTKITYTGFAVRTIFSLDIFSRENPFDFVILPLPVETREIRLVKWPQQTWINLYTRFIFRMFSCCKHISWISHKSSVAGYR